MRRIEFFAVGRPEPQGSARAFVVRGRVRVTSDNPNLYSWRDVIGWELRRVYTGPPLAGPVRVTATFVLPRPKSRKGEPTSRPDLDKLARGLFDALSHIAFVDDAQVVSLMASKVYVDPDNGNRDRPGVYVVVVEGA